jgi:hypothetical protein
MPLKPLGPIGPRAVGERVSQICGSIKVIIGTDVAQGR